MLTFFNSSLACILISFLRIANCCHQLLERTKGKNERKTFILLLPIITLETWNWVKNFFIAQSSKKMRKKWKKESKIDEVSIHSCSHLKNIEEKIFFLFSHFLSLFCSLAADFHSYAEYFFSLNPKLSVLWFILYCILTEILGKYLAV